MFKVVTVILYLAATAHGGRVREKIFADLHFPPDSIDLSSIVADGNKLEESDASTPYFEGSSLAYVAPWNNHGYDLAKQTAKKLDYISPVWFQAHPDGETCSIQGSHDIDRGWIEELRTSNEKLKIVPRIIFEHWSAEQANNFLQNEQIQRHCFQSIADFYTRNQFDGAVVEIYIQLLSAVQSLGAKEFVIELMETLAKTLNHSELEVIYTVPAPLAANGQPNNYVNPTEFRKLTEAATFVQVMTYDFLTNEPSGVAPFDWMLDSMEYLGSDDANLAKTMIGLNWYGYEFSKNGFDHVINKKYLEIAESTVAKIEWDDNVSEHKVIYGPSTIYYPSLTSLEMRIALAEKLGTGIAIWDYGQGLDYFCQLF